MRTRLSPLKPNFLNVPVILKILPRSHIVSQIPTTHQYFSHRLPRLPRKLISSAPQRKNDKE